MSSIIVEEKTAQKIASMLLEVEAIKLNLEKPFTWSSGWKSPIYCDNRITLSYPSIRNEIKKALVDAVKANYPDVEGISGVATAGIAQASLLANELGLPMSYVRAKSKGHGMENLIEGRVSKGQKLVVVEDLVSTGGSSLKAVKALREGGAHVLGMVSVFTYGFDLARKNFEAENTKLVSLSDYGSLLKYGVSNNLLTDDQLIALKAWRTDPENWTLS
jgi:orotate phosphoribosyltransferase